MKSSFSIPIFYWEGRKPGRFSVEMPFEAYTLTLHLLSRIVLRLPEFCDEEVKITELWKPEYTVAQLKGMEVSFATLQDRTDFL